MSGSTGGVLFNEIPYVWQVPGTFLEIRPSTQSIPLLNWPVKVLGLGGRLANSAAADLQAYPVTSPATAAALFGLGSQAERIASAALAASPYTPLFVMSAPIGTGAATAVWTLTLGGTWQSGQLPIYVGGQRILVPVASTDNAAAVIANLIAQAATLQGLQVTPTTTSGASVLTLTALASGVEYNNLAIEVATGPGDVLPVGMTVTVAQPTQGAGVVNAASIVNALGTRWYTDVLCAWNDTSFLATMGAEADRRFTAMVANDMMLYHAMSGTYASLVNFKATNGLNSKNRAWLSAQAWPTAPWAVAATFGAVGANFLSSDPARQLRGRVLPGVTSPRQANRWIEQQRQLLLAGNVTGTFNDLSDRTVVLERVITEYATNAQGVADPTFHDIMATKTSGRIRYDWATYMSLTYPNGKLAPDGSLAAENDPSVATPRKLKGSWAARCQLYEQAGWIQNSAATVAQSSFTIDPTDKTRCNAYQPVQGIGNLMVLAGALEFS